MKFLPKNTIRIIDKPLKLQNFSVEYSACSVARHISNVCIQREIKNSEDKKV